MPENIIALIYDFDQTLTPRYMQVPLFKAYDIDGDAFWKEKDRRVAEAEKVGVDLDQECAYMNLILRYVREGKFSGLSNTRLKELGKEVQLYPGLPDFFQRIKDKVNAEERYRVHDIKVENYVISTGIKEMILGSPAGPYLDGVFASQFVEEERVISEIARAIGYVKKTEFVHVINKGANRDKSIDINGVLPPELRRVPFENMIYIADGPTDVPCFAMLNKRGGTSLAVYNSEDKNSTMQAFLLRQQGRVLNFGPADYREGSQTALTIEIIVRNRADKILNDYESKRRKQIIDGPKFG